MAIEYCDDICEYWALKGNGSWGCTKRHRPSFRCPDGYEDIMETPPNWGFFKPDCKDLQLNERTILRRAREYEQKRMEPFDLDLMLLKRMPQEN
jgi:hypothetical protein